MKDKNKIAIEVYDRVASEYADKYFQDSTDLPVIYKFLDMLPSGGFVLDVGCGPGTFTHRIKDKGFRVEGIDFSREMIREAKERLKDVEFKYMDMRKLSYEDGIFDGLLVGYSLIHIPSKDILTTLKGFFRVLKKGGRILIVAQKGDSDQIVTEPLGDKKGKTFINFFKLENLAKQLEDAGFKVILKEESQLEDPDGSLSNTTNYLIGKKE